MPNFSYLTAYPAYALFAPAAVEEEKVYAASPAIYAVGCHKPCTGKVENITLGLKNDNAKH